MKLTFLGTGAADWDINAYRQGEEFRRFSSALVNDDLLIDPGPHIFHFADRSGQPELLKNVKNIIVTHTHADHFCEETVRKLCVDGDAALWGDRACIHKLERVLGKDIAAKVDFRETALSLNGPADIGGYEIWSLRSNHQTEDISETTRLYLIRETCGSGGTGRMLYYGCDSAWIPTESWNVIKDKPVDAMVLELTCGTAAPNDWRIFEHNTLEMLELMLKTFRKYGYFSKDVKYYTSHMARTLHTGHAELAKTLEGLGVTPAYDGMVIDI
jgi:hypothetical protein